MHWLANWNICARQVHLQPCVGQIRPDRLEGQEDGSHESGDEQLNTDNAIHLPQESYTTSKHASRHYAELRKMGLLPLLHHNDENQTHCLSFTLSLFLSLKNWMLSLAPIKFIMETFWYRLNQIHVKKMTVEMDSKIDAFLMLSNSVISKCWRTITDNNSNNCNIHTSITTRF